MRPRKNPISKWPKSDDFWGRGGGWGGFWLGFAPRPSTNPEVIPSWLISLMTSCWNVHLTMRMTLKSSGSTYVSFQLWERWQFITWQCLDPHICAKVVFLTWTQLRQNRETESHLLIWRHVFVLCWQTMYQTFPRLLKTWAVLIYLIDFYADSTFVLLVLWFCIFDIVFVPMYISAILTFYLCVYQSIILYWTNPWSWAGFTSYTPATYY